MLYRQLPWILGIAIIVGSLSYSAWQLYPIYQDIDGTKSIVKVPTTDRSSNAKPTPSKVSRRPEQYAMFGEFNSQPAEPLEVDENLPETKLRLTLTGVSASPIKEQARALIEGPDRSTESYKIGDSIPGNATLHSVHANKVVLNRSGKLETLLFPETSNTQLLSSVLNEQENDTTPTSIDYSRQIAPTVGVNPNTIPENLPKISPAQKQNIRDKLSALRARLNKQ